MKQQTSRLSAWTAMAVVAHALCLPGVLQAGVIATNADVPAGMNNTAGTESDPSVYVFDNYTRDFGTTSIQVGNSEGANWVRLEIKNGAQVSSAGTANRIGSDNANYATQFNTVLVTGPGSSLTLGESRIGGRSPNNSLIIQDGALMTFTDHVRNLSDSVLSTNNTVVVDNATLIIGDGTLFRMGYGNGHNYHTVVVRNGGQLTTATGRIGFRYGNNCDIRVEGHGSRIDSGYDTDNAVRLSEGSAHHNTLTLVDGGLCRLTHSNGKLGGIGNENNGVRFAAGFFAVAGVRVTHVPANRAWLWSGSEWEAAPSEWQGTFYADDEAGEAAALAETGYEGLAGYTVFTGGKPIVETAPATLITIR